MTLEKIILKQKQAITPENRIKTYRESALEMAGVEDKINSIKQLITQSSGQSNLLGFVGGVQTVAVWGIIIIIIAGFVFLALYMKVMRDEVRPPSDSAKASPVTLSTSPKPTNHRHREISHPRLKKISRLATIVFLVTVIGSLGTGCLIHIFKEKPPTIISSAKPQASETFPYTKNVYLANNDRIPVKAYPGYSSSEIFSLKKNQEVFVFRKLDNWLKIGLTNQDGDKNWWIDSSYTQNPNL